MGVISKGGIRGGGGKKRPGRACQHCDNCGWRRLLTVLNRQAESYIQN